MKKLISLLILLPYFLFAGECDWKTIKKQDGGYLYTIDCHIKVGELVQTDPLQKEEINILKSIIDSHKELLEIEQNRSNLWKTHALDLEKDLQTKKKWEKYSFWINFTLGVVVTSLSVHLASKLDGR